MGIKAHFSSGHMRCHTPLNWQLGRSRRPKTKASGWAMHPQYKNRRRKQGRRHNDRARVRHLAANPAVATGLADGTNTGAVPWWAPPTQAKASLERLPADNRTGASSPVHTPSWVGEMYPILNLTGRYTVRLCRPTKR